MSDSTNLNVRIDKELKLQADSLFNELGMNLTTAITVFIRQTVREKKIPFEITLETNDSAKVAAAIRGRDALRQLRENGEKRGFLSDSEINDEILAAKSGLRDNA